MEGALLASSPYVEQTLFDGILWLEADRSVRRERLRSDGREDQIERTLPPPEEERVIRIDAAGPVAQTVTEVQKTIESL